MHPPRAVARSGGQRQRPQEGTCARSPPSSRQQPSRRPPRRSPVTGVLGSSHREAPQIIARPDRRRHRRLRVHGDGRAGRADGRRELDPVRGSRPAGRTSTSSTTGRRYYINVDNTGDGVDDVRYRFQFTTRVRNPDSFLYALPGVDVDRRPEAQRRPDVRRHAGDATATGSSSARAARRRNLPGRARTTSGPKTIPDYDAVAARRIRALPGGGKVFAGPVDDPFFVDLGSRSTGSTSATATGIGLGNQGGGKDDLAGYNVHSIALQVPEAQVTRDGQRRRRRRRRPTRSSASGRRPSAAALQVTDGSTASGTQRPRRGSRSAAWATRSSTRWSSRSAQKDKFNRDPARGRPDELRQVRARAGARRRSSTRCSSLGSRRRTARTSSRRC